MASHWGRRTLVATVSAASAWALIGCASTNQAPVEDHSRSTAGHVAPAPEPAKASASVAPPVEAKPGTYIVQPGDILSRIGLNTGQGWKDLARWNNITDPDKIEVGQVLRVVPPPGETTNTTTTTTTTTFKPLPAKTDKPEAKASEPKASGVAVAGSAVALPPTASTASATSPAPLTNVATPAPVAHENDDEPNWAWPASGAVVAPFDDARSKGLSIAGKAGDPVYAAADGKVVYAGSGLRGYGNLVIVKHNANYLTAYAHNQTLLVKEDQFVKRGQKIAEMGSTDTDRVQLHFEIRRQGKPVDPAKLLPPR
ncbi:MAG: peptidoglycan DD-metalloendopeptidase family protein [Burkholderiaceae bacterium]